MPDIQVANDLLAAADVLTRRGWAQGEMERRSGQVCAIGALRIAIFGKVAIPYSEKYDPSQRDRFRAAREFMASWVGWPLSVWNDHKAKDINTVLMAFRQGAYMIAVEVQK